MEAAAAYLNSEDTDIGYLFSGWAQAALPHRRLPDDTAWQVTTDRVTLIVQPGLRPAPGGKPVSVGVPYGSRARLILLPANGGRQDQLPRGRAWPLAACVAPPPRNPHRRQADGVGPRPGGANLPLPAIVSDQAGLRTGSVNQHILDTSMFIEDDNVQGGLFVEKASLSQSFFEELKKHPVPVEEAAVRQIANNSLALDVYCWLAYRLHSLNGPINVSWKALHGQFGRSVARLDHFKEHFRTVLTLATSVYPDANVEENANGSGLILRPSKPPVAGRRPRLISGSR